MHGHLNVKYNNMQTALYCFRLLNFSQAQKVENRRHETYCKRVRKLICKIQLGGIYYCASNMEIFLCNKELTFVDMFICLVCLGLRRLNQN